MTILVLLEIVNLVSFELRRSDFPAFYDMSELSSVKKEIAASTNNEKQVVR